MAQTPSSMILRLCRVCRSQFQRPNVQQRSFSSTPQVKKTIPSFQPTSSPELDSLLLEFRTKVFVPEIVPSNLRKLIYKPGRQSILTSDPGVTYTTSNEEDIRLAPLHIHDRPRKTQSLHKVIALMKQREDWDNIPNLLEGLKASKYEPNNPGWYSKLVRKACEAGRVDIITTCAQKADKTGISYAMPIVMQEVIPNLHNAAAAAEWKGEALDEVIRETNKVVRVIEATVSDKQLKDGEVDYRRSPEVAGLLLELYSAKALNDFGGKDQDGKVLSLVKQLETLWPFGDYTINREHPTQTLSFLIPMWNGSKQALKVNGIAKDQAGVKLQKRLEELEPIIKEAKDLCNAEAKGKPRRGLNMYNALA